MPVDMKAMIAQKLGELLEQKNLDKITVRELVETCHISRQTFYYHFHDLMEVVEWNQHKVLEKALQRDFSQGNSKEAIKEIVTDVLSHKELILQLLESRQHDEIVELFLNTVRFQLREILRKKAPVASVAPMDAETMVSFYANGIVGMMIGELKKKEVNVEIFSTQLYRLLAGKITFDFTDVPV